MTPSSVGPLSRPFPVHKVTPAGTVVEIEANGAEREALARDLGLVALPALTARLRVSGDGPRIRVDGTVTARIEQTCVVSLDPFESTVTEDVSVLFAEPGRGAGRGPSGDLALDPEADEPEELTSDRIDLGAIAAEFLALGLDPYPRKPGVVFEGGQEEADDSPFARLAALRPGRSDPDGD